MEAFIHLLIHLHLLIQSKLSPQEFVGLPLILEMYIDMTLRLDGLKSQLMGIELGSEGGMESILLMIMVIYSNGVFRRKFG